MAINNPDFTIHNYDFITSKNNSYSDRGSRHSSVFKSKRHTSHMLAENLSHRIHPDFAKQNSEYYW